MKPEDLIAYLVVDEYSSTPKYKQLTNAILSAIESGKLKKNSLLPSINELSFKLEISRDTAEKGYRHLRKLGVVESVPGKGYFIVHTDFNRKLKICLLFNKLSTHKKIIYDAFFDSPSIWYKLITSQGEFDSQTVNYATRMYWYTAPAEYNVIRVAGIFALFSLNTFTGSTVLFLAGGYIGIWAMYKTFYTIQPKLHQEFAYSAAKTLTNW